MLTHARLHELVSYDPATGAFRRRQTGVRIDDTALSDGYRRISVDDRQYRGARLAWFYMTGSWPPRYVDHRDGNRANDRWDNLRLATPAQNQHNAGKRRDNTSGYKGVNFCTFTGRFRAYINLHGKQRYLGRFDTVTEARRAYMHAAMKHHGAFARWSA